MKRRIEELTDGSVLEEHEFSQEEWDALYAGLAAVTGQEASSNAGRRAIVGDFLAVIEPLGYRIAVAPIRPDTAQPPDQSPTSPGPVSRPGASRSRSADEESPA